MVSKRTVARTAPPCTGQPGERWAGSGHGPVFRVKTALFRERTCWRDAIDLGSKFTKSMLYAIDFITAKKILLCV